MALFFIAIGFVLVATALQNTTGQFFNLLKNDLFGQGGFLIWAGVIAVIGVGGAVTGLGKPARYLIALMVLVFLVTNGKGIVGKAQQAVTNAQAPAAASPVAAGGAEQVSGSTATPSSGGSAGGPTGGGVLSSAASGASSSGPAGLPGLGQLGLLTQLPH